jgi:DNA-directed RNA polymerase subunit RPC12/RpoP
LDADPDLAGSWRGLGSGGGKPINTIMSYENTECPCGGKKQRETLICAECERQFADTYEMKSFRDLTEPPWSRRPSAIRLLSMARRRNRRLPLQFLA